MPHGCWRPPSCRRIPGTDALWDRLRKQRHPGSANRHWPLVGGSFRARHASRHQSRWRVSLPRLPLDPHFTLVSDQDIEAIYAFLMTRPPVHNTAPAARLPFPLNIRLVMAAWNLLYFQPGRFKPVSGESEAWNQGAYIAEGLGHCGACHTPLNLMGAERKQRRYAGGTAEGWDAPALNAASPAPKTWTEKQLQIYLNAGFVTDHGMAAGPMMGVSHDLASLPRADVRALASYIASFMPASATNMTQATVAARKSLIPSQYSRSDGAEGTGTDRRGYLRWCVCFVPL